MFCGKCGKEMDSSAKFCPYCGAENQNRASAASTAKPTVPVKLFGGNVDVAKIALMVLGALHTLLFFTMSYGRIHLMSALNAIMGSSFSSRLTALNAISLMKGCVDLGIDGAGAALAEVTVLALLPVALGLAVLALSLKKTDPSAFRYRSKSPSRISRSTGSSYTASRGFPYNLSNAEAFTPSVFRSPRNMNSSI